MTSSGAPRSRAGALYLGALGVVFGDIGTSPIYTIQTVFDPSDPHPVPVSTATVYGITSLIFWSVTAIVTVTYVLLVMRADNHGEGGIMALITLVSGRAVPGRRRTKIALAALGIFGASLFFGDSMITPAISVLSAVEGLKVAAAPLAAYTVPITVVIVLALFAAQRFGTASVGRLFGPVMAVWFVTIALLGAFGIASDPAILFALSPTFALSFAIAQPGIAFFALAAVVLSVTGAEALYADMGHFRRAPISRAWLTLVFPACVINYFGQGALVLRDRAALKAPFFLLVPGPLQIPVVILATAATVIASQAVITGAFSVARQAVQLGYLPRLRIVHTSAESEGQVYVPLVNGVLAVSVIALVVVFQRSAALAFAFGMAVTGTITITTLLFLYLARQRGHRPLWLVVGGGAILLTIDGLFFAANLTKLVSGAWLPLLIGVAVYTIFSTWHTGRTEVTARREQQEGPLRGFVEGLRERRPPVQRVPGTGVFLNRTEDTTPLAMRACVDHLDTLHERVVLLSVTTADSPTVPPAERMRVDALGYADDGIIRVRARFGYLDRPDVPALLATLDTSDVEHPVDLDEATYFLSTIDLTLGSVSGLARWRKRLFLATAATASDAAQYFELPRERTIVMGSRVSV